MLGGRSYHWIGMVHGMKLNPLPPRKRKSSVAPHPEAELERLGALSWVAPIEDRNAHGDVDGHNHHVHMDNGQISPSNSPRDEQDTGDDDSNDEQVCAKLHLVPTSHVFHFLIEQ